MPICSYLVIPSDGPAAVAERLAGIPGCQAIPAENRDLVLLVTDTPGVEAERRLRARLESMPGVSIMVLTFGDIDPDTTEADPLRALERGRRLRVPEPSASGEDHPHPTSES